jgi:dienelactone hydrolase
MKTKRIFLLLLLLGMVIILASLNFKNKSGIVPGEFDHLKHKLKKILHTDNAVEGIDFIRTSNYANQRLFYYFFIPGNLDIRSMDSVPFLICVPGLSGSGESFGKQKIINDFSRAEGFIIIAPTFIWDQKNWPQRKSYHYPWVWSGQALIKVIEQFKKKNQIRNARYYLLGYSAGAQFALRFAVWRPDLCVACAAHGSGGWIGINTYITVKFFITVGTKDHNRVDIAHDFYHNARNLGIDVSLKTYDHGHKFSLQQKSDSLDFFRSCNAEQDD